jgi:hypothetical protein
VPAHTKTTDFRDEASATPCVIVRYGLAMLPSFESEPLASTKIPTWSFTHAALVGAPTTSQARPPSPTWASPLSTPASADPSTAADVVALPEVPQALAAIEREPTPTAIHPPRFAITIALCRRALSEGSVFIS